MSSPLKKVGNATTKKATVPIYKKYNKINPGVDPTTKLKPSDLSQSIVNVSGDDYPMIVEFVNILDNTAQIHSTVEIDQPLFTPAPNVVVFENFAAFTFHEKKLFFRNSDSVITAHSSSSLLYIH